MSDCHRSLKENVMISTAAFLGSGVAGFLESTVGCELFNYNKPKEPVIYAIWHGRQVGLGVFKRKERKNSNILISNSNDGEIITRVCKFLGFSIIRGSHKRGGSKALREILKSIKNGQNLIYTIDGPKGPIYKVKEGIVKIAQMSQAKVIPMVVDTAQKKEFNSWDKYFIPLPFSKMIGIFGEPIEIPKTLTNEESEQYRKKIEDSLFELQKQIDTKL